MCGFKINECMSNKFTSSYIRIVYKVLKNNTN